MRSGSNKGARSGLSEAVESKSEKAKNKADGNIHTEQIEYLIHQSTLGIHFLFERSDVARVMLTPLDEQEFFSLKNMERVQNLLTAFLEKPNLVDKERYLESLSIAERDLLIRAYFHLVENAIQSNFDLKH